LQLSWFHPALGEGSSPAGGLGEATGAQWQRGKVRGARVLPPGWELSVGQPDRTG